MVKRRSGGRGGGWGLSVSLFLFLFFFFFDAPSGLHPWFTTVRSTKEVATLLKRPQSSPPGSGEWKRALATRDACLKRGWRRWAQPFPSMEMFRNGESLVEIFRLFVFLEISFNRFDHY